MMFDDLTVDAIYGTISMFIFRAKETSLHTAKDGITEHRDGLAFSRFHSFSSIPMLLLGLLGSLDRLGSLCIW